MYSLVYSHQDQVCVCLAKYMGIYMMAIASAGKPMTRLHQANEKGWCDKRTIPKQGITTVTRSKFNQNKVWIATLKQGRSTSTGEVKGKMDGL